MINKQDMARVITSTGIIEEGQVNGLVERLYERQLLNARRERNKEEARRKALPPPPTQTQYFVRDVMRVLMYPAMVIGGTVAWIVIYFTFWG